MESYRVIDQESMLEDLDPMSHDIWGKPMADSISFDVGEGKDKGIMSVYDVKAGKYEFSAEVVDTNADFLKMFFGVNGRPKTFEEQCDECFRRKDREGLLMKALSEHVLLPIAVDRNAVEERIRYAIRLLNAIPCGYRLRKTTYKTIRRDCAKRNRRK